MKAAKIILGLAITGLVIVNTPILGETNPAPEKVTFDVSFLDLSGVMTIDGEKVSGYTVHIFEDGAPMDTFQVNNRLEQHYMLPLNHNYALKITKPGCKDRILLVNAHVTERKPQELYTFRYDIEFIKEGEQNTFDDFPVAFVHYDEKKKDFDYNRAYHANVRTDNPSETQTASKNWH